MPYTYSAEIHDWDLTLAAALELLKEGEKLDKKPPTGTLSSGFSCFTGSMLLSFCSVESFSTSVAFSMPNHIRFSNFNFEKFRTTSRFWDKLEILFGAIPYQIDRSQGIFQKIRQMQSWRNLVTHSSPYAIEETPVTDTIESPRKIHAKHQKASYPSQANLTNAQNFYETACSYIDLLKNLTEIEPRAQVTYGIGVPQPTVKVVRGEVKKKNPT